MSTKPKTPASTALSETLEDYLEIILRLSLEHQVVRVRDIAREKSVRMPTVTAALKRLAERGLIVYEAREFAVLTDRGAAIAGRVASRHRFLRRFLVEILGVPAAVAEQDACGLEHHLSPPTVERLAAFVEYLETCPGVDPDFLTRFRECFSSPQTVLTECADSPCQPGSGGQPIPQRGDRVLQAVGELCVGCSGEVARLRADEQLRTRLTRRGFLPGTRITKLRQDASGRRTVVELQGRELELDPHEAEAVFVDVGQDQEEASG